MKITDTTRTPADAYNAFSKDNINADYMDLSTLTYQVTTENGATRAVLAVDQTYPGGKTCLCVIPASEAPNVAALFD